MIVPLNDQVLVRIDAQEQKSAGGLFLARVDPVVKNTGVVVAVGESSVIGVKPGERVAFEKGMGRRFEVPVVRTGENGFQWTDQEQFVLVAYYDVLAVLEAGAEVSVGKEEEVQT